MQNATLTLSSSAPIILMGIAIVLSVTMGVVTQWSVAKESSRTALGTVACLAGALFLMAMGMDIASDLSRPFSDSVVQLVFIALGMLVLLPAMLDRVRPLGAVMFAVGVMASFVYGVWPFIHVALPALSIAAHLYVWVITLGAATITLLAYLPVSHRRFTSMGELKIQSNAAFLKEAIACPLLALVLTLLLWCFKAFTMVDTLHHTYVAFTAAVAASLAAVITCKLRHSPGIVSMALLALPAGVIATGLLNMASPSEVMLIAAMAGAAVPLVRDALIQLRIDEPSHMFAALVIPAMLGLLASGFLTLALLADAIKWAGAALAIGWFLGMGWRLVCQFTVGLALSRRRASEGLDTEYAALQMG